GRSSRAPARRRRQGRARLSQDHHRRRHRGLERVQRDVRRPRRQRGHRRAGAIRDRQRPAHARSDRHDPLRGAPAGAGRRHPAGDRRHRERAARRAGACPRHSRLRAAGRAATRAPASVLVALWLLPPLRRRADADSAAALQYIRSRIDIPVASLESQYTRRGYREFFERQAVDVAIVDTPWNGVAESLKIAAMADTYEVNVAPHNFYGHLATMMNAHFCAVAPNFRIMEIDVDAVPWLDELYTVAPRIEAGHLVLPTGPGWGTEVNE